MVERTTKYGNTKVFPLRSFMIGPYVGIIQIRFMGRSLKLPLSLFISSPFFTKSSIGHGSGFVNTVFKNRGRGIGYICMNPLFVKIG
jgi:hypothetical protein